MEVAVVCQTVLKAKNKEEKKFVYYMPYVLYRGMPQNAKVIHL